MTPEDITAFNLRDENKELPAFLERRAAYLAEYAHIVTEEIVDSDEVSGLLADAGERFRMFLEKASPDMSSVLPVHERELSAELLNLSGCDAAVFAMRLSAEYRRMRRGLFLRPPERFPQNTRVAVVDNRFSDMAFDKLVKYAADARIYHADNFRIAAESTAIGDTTGALLPIEGPTGEWIMPTIALIEEYDLLISAVFSVGSKEETMRYALLTRRRFFISEGALYLSCRVIPSTHMPVPTVLNAAATMGMAVHSIDSDRRAAREKRAFLLTLQTNDCSAEAFLTYCALFTASFTFIGFYPVL